MGPRGRSIAPRAVALVLICGAFTYLLVETRRFFIDVPFWDEWLLLPLISLQARHQLDIWALLTPHNEHIPFFPRLLLVWLARVSGWNLWYECVANLVLGVVTLVPLLLLIRGDPGIPRTKRYVLYAAVGVTVLSLNQWENWIWGWQVEVFMNAAAVSSALLLLTLTDSPVALGGAALCGVVATFSFATGPLFWPVTAPLVWCRRRGRMAGAIAWMAVATACLALYASRMQLGGLTLPGGHLATLTATLGTTLCLIGSGLGGYLGPTIAGVLGLLGVVAGGAAAWPTRDAGRSPAFRRAWLTLAAYGITSAALIALGRTLPVRGALPSRYFTFANLYFVGVAVLLVRRWPRLAWFALVVPLMAVVTGLQGRDLYVGRKGTLSRARASLYAPVDNPLTGRFFWDRRYLADWLPLLSDMRLSLYDCQRQLSKPDWDNAAKVVLDHSRPGDTVVTSSDWAASCLGERVSAHKPGVVVISAGESDAKAQQLVKERRAAFLISGGDTRSLAAKVWIETHGFPLYRSPVGSMRLFFHPDRIAYLLDRLTPRELAGDEAAFRQAGDLTDEKDQRFFPSGWSRWGEDPGRGRLMLERTAFLYVPVLKEAPRWLSLAIEESAAREHATLTIAVNDVAIRTLDLASPGGTWQIDLAAIPAWRFGANIVRLDVGGNERIGPAPGRGDHLLPLRVTGLQFTAEPRTAVSGDAGR